MACSKAEDLINQLIEATLKLLDFGLNIMDALRVQKLLAIRNQKIGLISDDACLPECSLRFSLNFDLMMFNKLLRNACLRARATLNELRVCRLRYPNAPLVLEPKTKVKFHKLQKKIQEFDEAVRADKMIARRDLRDFREISIIFSQLEHDLKLLICSLECASTMKDTVLFAAPITDVMTVLSIVLNRLERLAQKAEIDEKIAAAEQQKALQDQKVPSTTPSNSVLPQNRQQSTTKTRTNDVLYNGKNTNRISQQQHRHQQMSAMIAAASQQNLSSNNEKKTEEHRQASDTLQTTQSDKSLKESNSIELNNNNKHHSKLPRHYTSIKSNISPYRKKNRKPMENFSDKIPSNRHQIKQYRNEFIRKWTDNARHLHAQNHVIHSSQTYSDQMTNVDLKKNDRHRRRKIIHHRSRRRSLSTSPLLNNSNSSSSSSSSLSNELHHNKPKESSFNSSIVKKPLKMKHRQTSSNNSAVIDQRNSKLLNDDIECKIS